MTAANDSTHAAVWGAIEELAKRRGVSLHKLSLDVFGRKGTYCPSKRTDEVGKLRWPKMSLVAKTLDALDVSFAEFGAVIDAKLSTHTTEAANGR